MYINCDQQLLHIFIVNYMLTSRKKIAQSLLKSSHPKCIQFQMRSSTAKDLNQLLRNPQQSQLIVFKRYRLPCAVNSYDENGNFIENYIATKLKCRIKTLQTHSLIVNKFERTRLDLHMLNISPWAIYLKHRKKIPCSKDSRNFHNIMFPH